MKALDVLGQSPLPGWTPVHSGQTKIRMSGGSSHGCQSWHGREQILSRAAAELMTSDQLTPEQRAGSEIFFDGCGSWGLGMAVEIERSEIYRTPGRFGWDGGLGTSAYTDPAEGMIGILFTQRMMDSPEPPKVFSDFWTLAYAAME